MDDALRILFVRLYPWRQLNPRMSAAAVDRILRWGKARVGEGAHGHIHMRLLVTFLGVEQIGPPDGREPERELDSSSANANILGCSAKDLVGSGEASQRCKHTAGPTLAGEAVANASAEHVTLNFNAQLSAATGGGSRRHLHLVILPAARAPHSPRSSCHGGGTGCRYRRARDAPRDNSRSR